MSDSAAERLDLRDIRRQAEALGTPTPEAELTPREQPIDIKYRNPDNGKLLDARVISRIMNGEERATVARVEALLARVAWDAIPPVQRGRFHMLATCEVMLRDKPDWLMKWLQEDDELLTRIYGALEVHETAYFRRDVDTSEDEEGEARVSVSWKGSSKLTTKQAN